MAPRDSLVDTRPVGKAQVARDVASTVKVLARLGPRLPGLAKELVMLAEEARIHRKQAGEPSEVHRESRWPWLLGGIAVGLTAAAGLLLVL